MDKATAIYKLTALSAALAKPPTDASQKTMTTELALCKEALLSDVQSDMSISTKYNALTSRMLAQHLTREAIKPATPIIHPAIILTALGQSLGHFLGIYAQTMFENDTKQHAALRDSLFDLVSHSAERAFESGQKYDAT